MTKYIDADKLKVDIKNRYDNMLKRAKLDSENANYWNGKADAYRAIYDHIDSLQQEQPKVDLKKEIDEIWNPRFNLGWDEHSAISINHEGFVHIAHHFYELGCRRTAEKADEIEYNRQRAEESVPNDLEEAAHLFSQSPEPLYSPGHRFHWDDDALFGKQIETTFIAGAKWQAKQFLKGSPMPEDTVLFNKGVEEGKRLMMKDAVCYIAQPDIVATGNIVIPFIRIGYTALSRYGIKVGDKVRIIIVKED